MDRWTFNPRLTISGEYADPDSQTDIWFRLFQFRDIAYGSDGVANHVRIRLRFSRTESESAGVAGPDVDLSRLAFALRAGDATLLITGSELVEFAVAPDSTEPYEWSITGGLLTRVARSLRQCRRRLRRTTTLTIAPATSP